MYDAGRELEKSQDIWGKNKFNCIDIAGKVRNSLSRHNFAQEFVPMTSILFSTKSEGTDWREKLKQSESQSCA